MNLTAVGDTRAALDTTAKASTAVDSKGIGTKENFLQLLIAQIKNQNPLNPQDGTQFLSQLSQFTETEQMLGMRADLAAIRTALEKSPTSADSNS